METFSKKNLNTKGVNYIHAMGWTGKNCHTTYKVIINGVVFAGADNAYEAYVVAYSARNMLQALGYETRMYSYV